MNIEKAINSVIETKLQEGIIEKLVAENLEKGINNALERLLGNFGDVTQVIEKEIKDVMLKQLESYDYSKYLVKLDYVLTEILKKTALDHKKILENFKELMTDQELPRTIKVSDIFEEYKKYVAQNVDTTNLEVCFDDGPFYEPVTATMEIENEEKRSWSSFEGAKIIFECKEDEDLNREIRLSKFDRYPWSISGTPELTINSLRRLDSFGIYLIRLSQGVKNIEIDENWLEDEVEPAKEPEPEFR